MIFLRRLIKRLVVVWLLGFVAKRLVESSDPRLQRAGRALERFVRPGRARRRSTGGNTPRGPG